MASSFPPRLPPQSPPDLPSEINSNARLRLRKNTGSDTGQRRRINLIEGSGIGVTLEDDGENEEVKVTLSNSSPGVTDHGALTGLADDDHPQYATNTDLTNHEGDTTAVHGITNTASLVVDGDAAGGSLTGTYPNPTLAALSVGAGAVATDWPGFAAQKATFSVANNTEVAVSFTTANEVYDVGSWHGSTTSIFDTPRNGYYVLTGYVEFETGIYDAELNVQIRQDGIMIGKQGIVANGAIDSVLNVTAITKASAGDDMELFVYQNSGGSMTCQSARFSAAFHGNF